MSNAPEMSSTPRRTPEATRGGGAEEGQERHALQERLERARDVVEAVREHAEHAFRERPYLVPVAAGAVGLVTGILIGSRLTRFLVVTAVGAVLGDVLGGEIKRVSHELLGEMQRRLAEGERHEEPAPPAARAI